jgi:hypothetical protein
VAALRSAGACACLVASVLSATPAAAEDSHARSFAARAGWAYGLGVELEYRPGSWGIGASGGYVPGYGPGGYLGVQWGMHPLERSGLVAEAGVFRGVHSPLRVADDGFGPYLLAGYTIAHADLLSARAVAGGGVPLGDPDHPVSFEFLAKLTAGVLF